MKQNKVENYIADLCKLINDSVNRKKSFSIDNFHPCLISPIIDHLNFKIIFYFENSSIDSFSFLFDRFFNTGSAVKLYNNTIAPDGFNSENNNNNKHALELIKEKDIKFIIAEKGVDNKKIIIKENKKPSFDVNKDVDRELIIEWLQNSGYNRVETVYEEGEYAVRGSILDVYSFASANPIRINFFDDPCSLSYFNVNSQLTYKNFSSCLLKVNSVGDKEVLLKEMIRDQYFPVFVKNSLFFWGEGDSKKEYKTPFQFHVYNSFLKNKHLFKHVLEHDALSHFSISKDDSVIIPKRFINSRNLEIHDSRLNNTKYNKGDFFVHKKFGVGVFYGFKKSYDGKTEQLILKYKNNEFVNISVENLDNVSFFSHKYESDLEPDSISKKGSWKRKISNVQKEINLVVDSILLSITEKSKVIRHPYNINKEDLDSFLQSFEHNDTRDQLKTWRDILKDLTKNKPMNRLVCGDVGFGKTELAMRASFVVSFEKQVILLAPTTILALQLYNSFTSRFKNFPQRISLLSRLQTGNEKKYIIKSIKSGTTDIIIGTHALLSESISFNNVGLVIVDEEHRFGVKQKEKIASFSLDLDILYLSATPIPRSLQLSFSGLKTLSVMNSPPLMRKPIITKIFYSSKNILYKFISYEINRNGQVYIVYNNVENIQNYTNKIVDLFPNLKIDFIHGKLSSQKIEKNISSFIKKEIDVLVCSTIIEAGLDVPNTNTIIIENSQNFGLSQLYQLRGRVGRSSEQAFAILLIPNKYKLSNISKKRLKTIEKNNSFGSGFIVAKKDLDIRGSGSLFGYSQSGKLSYIGKELYSQLIKDKVELTFSKKSIFIVPLSDVVVSIYSSLFIEDSFISNQYLRFDLYKKIFSSSSFDSLQKIEKEILNRFGLISKGLLCLFNTQKIRILCSTLGVSSLILSSKNQLLFSFTSKVENFSYVFSFSKDFFNKKKLSFRFDNAFSDKIILELDINKNLNVFSIVFDYLTKLKNSL